VQEGTLKEIILEEYTLPADLADLMDVSTASVFGAAFEWLGRMLTINETLRFHEAQAIAKEFGYMARRSDQ
jgi:hypothetical protein